MAAGELDAPSKPKPPASRISEAVPAAEPPSSKAADVGRPPSANSTPPAAKSSRSAPDELADVRVELKRVLAAKTAAVEEEDFKLAAELKKEQQALEAQVKQLEAAQLAGVRSKLAETRQELRNVKAEKARAAEEEDYLAAAAAKKRQLTLESQAAELEEQLAAAGVTDV
eukprot:gnl/TRDRNA2_/TRDRNA2_119451_c2_seq1.p1 gnl/TRDRNA2_/TRDRNA2_119451_c2~~gnl/TRDRNA2_/TRDRNA2_119451_c2_seq1.p1  ORF type:complete len:184 (-),score=69.21 gnl/TRDRNA2_/TRDRNA2_119451_c2_seq1:108-617(-)